MSELSQEKLRVPAINPPDLAALATKINTSHRSAISSAKSALTNAISCGLALLEVKAKIGHGGWESWLVDNAIEVGPTQRKKYMRLAKFKLAVEQELARDPELTISRAYTLTYQSDEEPERKTSDDDALVNKTRKALVNVFNRDPRKAEQLAKRIVEMVEEERLIEAN